MILDSNIVIYAAEPSDFRCARFIEFENAAIASVTRIEVLGFPGYDSLAIDRKQRLHEIVAGLLEIKLDDVITERAIDLRRQKRLRLADAIIAATALVSNLDLVTRNVADFKNIAGLYVINPFDDRD
ncbi:MAG: type II toxin-antitoxin system VapC family toxin [Candidatus Hydrogenedentes bacterium]|nr:type II toxin-antitoxin system VapC family toxin [Candidatus Hydrogenedentota bacterium]